MFPAGDQWIQPQRGTRFVDIRNDFQSQFFLGVFFAKLVHVAKFPQGVNMHQGKRWLGWVKRLECQMHHDRRVFPDRIQHDRVAKFGYHLAYDMNGLSFKLFQMGQLVGVTHRAENEPGRGM